MTWSPASGREDVKARLREIGSGTEAAIDIAEAALLLAALDRPRVPLAHYRQHLEGLARDTAAEAEGGRAAASSAERRRALSAVITGNYGYCGDSLTYDDLQNANLMRVIDRRRGLPVAISILYIHAARAQGWPIEGLNFPGHFLLRMETSGDRCIFDPFNGGEVLETPDLRRLIKSLGGDEAELRPEFTAPMGTRDILLRLQNNIKLRLIRQNRPQDALEAVESMVLLAPRRAACWREAGLLHRHLGNLRAAILAFENALQLSDDEVLRHETARLMQQLQNQLN